MREDLGILKEMAEQVGVRIEPAESRGEVIIEFPSLFHGDTILTLRLSRMKAFSLLFWLDTKISLERGKEAARIAQERERELERELKGGESHG
jgi:hypothetical protein